MPSSGFAEETTCPVGSSPTAIELGDLNGDGLPDIVLVSQALSEIEVFLSQPRALTSRLGTGCAGTGGLTPQISGPSLAIHGGVATVALADARPSAGCVLGVSVSLVPSTLAPTSCVVYLASPVLTFSLVTTPRGTASLSFAVPQAPAFTGDEIYFQWAVFDPFGAYQGILAFSDALRMRVGF